ncbi:MAG: hypothetical protein QM778_14750 [Myxococcales bacterium]
MSRTLPFLSALLLTVACGDKAESNGRTDAGDDGTHEGDGDGDGTGSDAGTTPGDDAGSGPHAMGTSRYFPSGSFFVQDVYDTPKAQNSDATIKALRAHGGWGNKDVFQIDFSLDVLSADQSTPKKMFTPRTEANGYDDEFYTPDCDLNSVPVPASGNVEGEDGYVCMSDGDCHLLVFQPDTHALYELWRADIQGTNFISGCQARWDTSKPVTNAGRGLQCSSADAAGFPISPLLFTADEVKAGKIEHAIRFILPNDRVREGFVPPATHGTRTTGGAGSPYYGVHLRLRRDYPLEQLPSEGARTVARALQRFGMYHADGGQIALTAQSDRHTTAKWDGLLEPRDLAALKVEDFEVIDHGAPIELTFDCGRTQLK